MPRFHAVRIISTLITFASPIVRAGNTTCAGSALDWYTNQVGETPCMTYQRLRQICNSDYEVPSFRANTPGDNCDDQLTACCCNSISWALSMLCMNCQWDTSSSSVNGIDAGVPAYYMYRFSDTSGQYCGDGTNMSLPVDIQTTACDEGVTLEDFLYTLFWNTGAWFYTYTRETAQEQFQSGNSSTHCPSSSSSPAPSTINTVTTTQSIGTVSTSSTTSQPNSGAGPSSSDPPPSQSSVLVTSVMTTFESLTTDNGTPTSVAVTALATVTSVNATAVGLTSAGGHKSNAGPIAGAVVGGVVALVGIGALVAWFAWGRRKTAGQSAAQDGFDMIERRPYSPGQADPFEDSYAVPPMGKGAIMQRNAFPNSSSGCDFRPGPGSSSASQAALIPGDPTSGSATQDGREDQALRSPATESAVSVNHEEDAGRIAGGGLQLPPTYQSEWNDDPFGKHFILEPTVIGPRRLRHSGHALSLLA